MDLLTRELGIHGFHIQGFWIELDSPLIGGDGLVQVLRVDQGFAQVDINAGIRSEFNGLLEGGDGFISFSLVARQSPSMW